MVSEVIFSQLAHIIITYVDSSGDQLNCVFVQYIFSGKPHIIITEATW